MTSTSKKPANTLPYIGSRISLISKSDIRYEGTLYTIDPTEHTVSLSNVRSFGTEGRRQDGHEIPASGDIYEYIIFRGSDIKDLRVVQSSSTEEQKPPAKVELKNEGKPDERPAAKAENEPLVEAKPEPARPQTTPTDIQPAHSRGGYRHHRPGDFQRNSYPSPAADLHADFDFTEANSHLQRTEKKQEPEDKTYDRKRSFFDSMTSSVGDSRRETREEREFQRTIDSETFGTSNVEKAERDLRTYSHRGRRGRGRFRRGNRPWHPANS